MAALNDAPSASYYNVPIELIRVIHCMCEPECFGTFRIADARLFNTGSDYFEDYKKSQLVEINVEMSESSFKTIYTSFREKRHGECKTWYDDASPTGKLQLQSHSFYVHGRLHGECKNWFNNGQLRARSFYVRGQLHGKYKVWFNNGQLRSRAFYINEQLHGECKDWFHSEDLGLGKEHAARLREHAFYVHGQKHGEFKSWHDNEQLDIHTHYIDGRRHGECKAWHRDGLLYVDSLYVNGDRIKGAKFDFTP